MIRLKEHKGITLIALVITIIVLLILAGVTINSIMGQDGTPEKAVEARKKNDQGAEFDAIKLAVVGAMGERMDVKVDAESLKNELNGIVEDEGRLAIRDDNAPWIVAGKKGGKYKIYQDGTVTIAEPVATVEFKSTTDSIAVGKLKKIEIICKGASGNVTEANEVTFTSSDTSIATVQDDGSIKIADNATVGATATITVVADGIAGSNECEVTVKEDIWQIGTAINADKYGWKVLNYISDAESSQDEIGWRLFYQDNENTYIIADEPQGNYKPEDYIASYPDGSYVNSLGKGLNITYYTNFPNSFTANWNWDGIRVLAWMTDTTQWSRYLDSNTFEKAKWAIASPSIELYILSYNADASNDNQTNLQLPNQTGPYGYSNFWKGLGRDLRGYNRNIYGPKNNLNWWIASSTNENNNNFIIPFVLTNEIWNWGTNQSCSIRPLVCLTTEDFNSTYTLSDE